MTDKEAIEELKEMKTDVWTDHRQINAISMAIRALEQKPCEDAISRQAVLEIFGDIHLLDYNAQAYANKIKALPSVTPTVIEDIKAEIEDSTHHYYDGEPIMEVSEVLYIIDKHIGGDTE